MPTETLQDFLDTYNEGDVHNLITVDVPQSTNDTYSPFILVRFGKFAAIINPQGLGNEDDPKRHLSIASTASWMARTPPLASSPWAMAVATRWRPLAPPATAGPLPPSWWPSSAPRASRMTTTSHER